MRSLNDREREILTRLVSVEKGRPIAIEAFLEEYFFTKDQGRALIIQVQGRYAVFYLRKDVYDDPLRKNEELHEFLELISLLHLLKNEGYLTIFRGSRARQKTMYFIQDGFIEARPSKSMIILNKDGDYTSSPDTIHSKEGEVIYQGVVFESDTFEMILSNATGQLIISEQLSELLGEKPTDLPKSSESQAPPLTDGRNWFHEEHPREPELKPEPLPRPPAVEKPMEPAPEPPVKPKATPKPETVSKANEMISIGKSRLRRFEAYLVSTIALTLLSSGFSVVNINQQDQALKELRQSLVHAVRGRPVQAHPVERAPKRVTNKPVEGNVATTANSTYYGIDISKWNGNIVKEIHKLNHITFIVCKATEGLDYVDPMFKDNWSLIEERNYIRGAYHFYRSNDDPVRQAAFFCKTVGKLRKTDMPLVLDIEELSIPPKSKIDIQELQNDLLTFLKHVEHCSGKRPMVYTDYSFATHYLSNQAFAEYPLWLAEYTDKSNPSVPAVWKKFKIWQKTNRYTIDSDTVDLDVYTGNITSMYR